MKKLLLLSIILFSFTQTSQASHVIGGEMGWTCLPTGKYIFYMTIYRDCTGISFGYNSETINIVGSPLPKDTSGNSFSTIALAPDSNRWNAENKGDLSPSCSITNGAIFSCENGDPGTVQQFFYKSTPVTLSGNPNNAGWKFYWESFCCRPGQVANVNANGTMLLRAEMYRTKNVDDKDPCIDSSPEFKSLPTTVVCRGYEFTYNSAAIDTDLDSLIYSWDRPYNPPYEVPVALTYKPGFSPSNPTPDSSFDSRNIPATIDSVSGQLNMAVFSGTQIQNFITVTKVESYRNGVKISTVYREIPLAVFDCPKMPNGKENTSPQTVINGDTTLEYNLTVVAGQKIKIPIEVIDTDYWDSLNTKQQVISLQPEGLMFSRDRANPDPCQVTFGAGKNLIVEPCAYMENLAPSLDTSINPPSYTIQDTGSIQTNFIWQTDCAHIQTKTGVPGTNERRLNFVFKVSDDHCPLPGTSYPTLSVKLKDPIPLTAPIMKGINVDLTGEITYQWVPAIDSAFSFENYIVEETKTVDGQPPIAWNNLNNNLKDFQQEKKNVGYQIHRNVVPIDPTSPRNILQKIAHRDWYMRMRAVSGCTNDVVSKPSDPVRIIELDAIGINDSLGLGRDRVNLSWNAPKTDSAMTYDYFYYESETRYYIWQSDSVYLAGLSDSSNWYLRDSTYSTSKEISSNSCNDYAAFRIEARDTVITWKRGNAPSSSLDSLDTLTFSTYSVIDTLFLNYAKPTVQRIGTQVLNSDYPADTYQWIDCNADSLLTNENSRELQLSDTGRYAVITSNGSCMDTSDCFTVKADLNNSIVKMGRKTLLSLDSLANYQWFDCEDNSLIQGANNRTYQATDTGRFGVIVSVFNFSERSNCLAISLNLNDSIVLIGKDTLQSLDTLASYQWYNCGKASIIAGATERSFVMKDTGYYAVIVSDFGYSDTSNCYPYFPIGLPKQSFQEGIVVYPNPTNEKLNIRLNKNYKNVQLRVISIHGQVVQEKQINQQQLIELNLTGEPGIYFIQLTNSKGERANFKVVKQ